METPDPYTTRDRGFTLIELLVVIVILGILSAIVVFSVNGITNRGERSACQANVETVNIASEAYRAQNTGYALTLPALQSAGFLKTIPGTMAGDGLSFSVPEGGYTVTYDPLSGLASAGCAAAGGGSGTTTTTTAGGGGGGGGGGTTTTSTSTTSTTSTTTTSTTAVPCAMVVNSAGPSSVDVDDDGPNLRNSVTFTVRTTGNCGTITMVVDQPSWCPDLTISGLTAGAPSGGQTTWTRSVSTNTYSWCLPGGDDVNDRTVTVRNNGNSIGTFLLDMR
jgi:general secretion pathway protein G